MVARVTRRRGQLAGEPLSLVLPGRAINPIDALHFDDAPRRRQSTLVERLLKSGTPDQPALDNDGQRPAAVPVPLADLRALIEAEAQRGCAGVAPGAIRERVPRRTETFVVRACPSSQSPPRPSARPKHSSAPSSSCSKSSRPWCDRAGASRARANFANRILYPMAMLVGLLAFARMVKRSIREYVTKRGAARRMALPG
jgi:hypothetical protein